MCFICDQQSGFETDLSKILQLNQTSSFEVSEGINSNSANKSFQSSDLIGQITNEVKVKFSGKETIYYYIHDSYDEIYTRLFGYQDTESHDSGSEKFIENVFQSIDGYIELDFERTYSKSEGNIDIYYFGTYEEGALTGYADTGDLSNSNVEIYWEKQWMDSYIYGDYGSLQDVDAMTLIHEIGHAIGLSHPQNDALEEPDDPEGLWHDADDTVMSYRYFSNPNLAFVEAPAWRPADIAALQSIWGVETGSTPTSISLSSTNFNENIQANTSIATLSTTDADVNDTFTYTLVSGAGDTDNSYFTINGSSLKINSSPDYETKSSYNVRIKTTDSGNNSYEKSFTLSVNDLNEDTTNIPSERPATSIELQQLYIAYFSRPSDPTGLDYWTWNGISRSAFAANMYLQPEFNNVNSGLSVEAQVNQIYLNLFSREADITGLTYWAKQIRNGVLQLASIANDLIWAAENNSGSSNDKTALTNKTNAAVAYTAKIRESTSSILAYQAQSTNPWVTGNNLTEAKNYISGIDLYNTHTSWGIENSIAKFSSLSASNNYKLAIDSNESNVDIITGIETNIHAANTLEVAVTEIDPISSETLDNDYLLDLDHQTFVSNLYEEVLQREPDSIGMNYWLGQLNSGAETRYEVLLGFSQSAESTTLFTDMTGLG